LQEERERIGLAAPSLAGARTFVCSTTQCRHGVLIDFRKASDIVGAWTRITTLVKNTMIGTKGHPVVAAILPVQCRAARGLVDMTLIDLAKGASISKNVIVDFEKGRRVPNRNNLSAIQRVLEEAGVEFTNGDAPGVRLRKKKR
jgi:hypothetical protein